MTRKSAIALEESRARAATLKANRLSSATAPRPIKRRTKQAAKPSARRLAMLAGEGGENEWESRPKFAPSVASYEPKEVAPQEPLSFLIHVHKAVVADQERTYDEPNLFFDPSLRGETKETRSRLHRVGKLIGRDRGFWEWLSTQLYYPEGEKPHDANRHWVDMGDRAKKGYDCGDHLIFHEYFTEADKPMKLAGGNFCGQNHLCTFCSSRRAVRALQILVPRVLGRMQEQPQLRPAMLTITQRNDEDLTRMVRRHFRYTDQWLQAVRNARKGLRRACALSTVDGAIGSCETKRGSGSGEWHFHAHWLVLVPPGLDEDYFKTDWDEIVGYDSQCKLKYCHSVTELNDGELPDREAFGHDCLEVIKYALKTTELGWGDRLHAWQVLRGRRLIRSMGSIWGFKPPEEETDDLTGLEDKPYREVVFRYLKGLYIKEREKYLNGENQERQVGGVEWVY